MKKDNHFTSRMTTLAGWLMTVSCILMALCSKLAIGGIFWAAASCLFFAARQFRIAENKKEHEETNTRRDKKFAFSLAGRESGSCTHGIRKFPG